MIVRASEINPRAAAVALGVAGLFLAAGTPAAAQSPGLIPRQVLFGNPDKASPKISPDGTKISYLADVEGVINLWVAPAGDLRADFSIDDIPVVMCGLSSAMAVGTWDWRRFQAIVLDGLRAR